jgi:hypothetical protein
MYLFFIHLIIYLIIIYNYVFSSQGEATSRWRPIYLFIYLFIYVLYVMYVCMYVLIYLFFISRLIISLLLGWFLPLQVRTHPIIYYIYYADLCINFIFTNIIIYIFYWWSFSP